MKYYRVTGWGVNGDFLPVQLFDFMKENNIKGRPFNHFGTGGYLVWTFPDQKNFIDSRNLNDEIYFEYNSIMTMRPGFEGKLDNHGIDYVLYLDPDLIRRPQELGQTIVAFLSRNNDKWKLVFWDDKSMLFLRNKPEYTDVISKYEYKVLNPYTLIFNKTLIDTQISEMPDKAKDEFRRKLQSEPNGNLLNTFKQYYPAYQ